MKLLIDCPVLSVVSKTPEFQALKERFTYSKHGNDHLLLNLLVQYREDNNLGKEWYPESEEQMQEFGHFVEENTRAINPKGKTSDELVNLYNTMYTQFTPEQLRERISYITYDFWNVVNRLEDNDTTGKSRLKLIEGYSYNGQRGYKAILEYIFDQYDNWATEQFNVENISKSFRARGTDLTDDLLVKIRKLAHDKAQKYKVIVDNKAMLSALALAKIGETEGLVVRTNGLEVNFSEMSEGDLNDGATDVNDDNDDNDDNDGTKGDRYYDYRTAKLMDTLSVQCRRILFGIPQLNSQGKTVNNDLIRPKLLDLRRTVVTLKRIALNSTPDTFLQDINAASVEMPWLKGVYDKLSNNPADAAAVYSSVKGNETTYCATILDKGRYKTIVVNSKARGKALMAEAGRNIAGGLIAYDENYSITDGNGDIVSAENLQKVYDRISALEDNIKDFTETISILDDYEYNEDTDDYAKETRYPKVIAKLVEKYGGSPADYEYLKQGGTKAMETFLSRNANLVSELASHLRGIGFDVMASDIRNAALESIGTFENAKKYWGVKAKASNANKLSGLVTEVRAFVKSVQDFKRQNPSATGAELYAQRTDEYSDINKYLALSRIGDLEDRVVNEGKSLQTINNVSLLHQRLDKIAKMSDQEIREKVLPYEGMGLGFGDELRATGWLTGAYKGIKVFDGVSFNHKEYGKMSPQQKMTNALLNYFMPPSWNSNHLYEVCIQSDYDTAYNFVSAPSYTKDELVRLMSDEVLIELERIASIQERIENDKDRIKYNVRDKQGQKIFIFPELNSNGFISEYNKAKTVGPDEAERVLHRHVSEQLDKLAARDAAYYDSKGIFRNKYLKFVPTSKSDHTGLNFYSEKGTFEDLDQKAKDAFMLMAMNYYYARQQITKLTVGDLAHFNGLADFEKRNMMFHTPHTSMYAREDMVYKDKPAGISKQKVVYIEDDVVASKYVEEAKKCLKALYDKKVITKSQFDNMSKAYDKIKVTDGQGFRTLDSRRRLDIAAGNWSDKLEDAYWRIMAGKPNSSDIEIFFNPEKPVYTGYDVIPAAVGQHQKPVQVPVFHKYSEVILLPESLSGSSIQAQSSPMRALSKVASEKGIDLMMFSSNVKVGGFSVITPFAKDKDGNRILTNESEFTEYMSSEIDRNPSSVHILDLEGYGIAASIAAHGEDDKISFSTQAEKECFADIEDGEISGGNIEIDGKKATNDQLRTIYYQTKAADIMDKYNELQRLFGNPIELERILKEELQSKSYYSREMVFAIEQLKNGGTAFPLFAPNIRHNVEQLMASIITKRLTKPRYSGANLPEATAFGIDMDVKPFTDEMLAENEKLGIHFETDENGTRREYIDVYTTIYDSAFEPFADENGVITFERLWGKDGTGKTEGLVAEGKIPREALEFIAYRTPSDYTHSLFNCRIKGFIAKTGGQVLYMPKTCMVQDGHDYDGDKKRCHFPSIKLGWDEDKMREAYSGNEKYASFEKFSAGLKSPRNIDRNKYRKITYNAYDFSKSASENNAEQRHNGRIKMLLSVLSSSAGSSRAMTPGEFDDTKVLAKAHYIIRNIDASKSTVLRGIRESHKDDNSLYSYLTGLSDGQLSALMDELNANESPFSLTHAGQSYEYIMEPADMIGIYAMYGSTAMMLQRANLYYQPKYTKDGKPYEIEIFGHKVDKLYQVRDRNGHYTSVTRSHLLNAAVDNGKDPVLGLLNQNPKLSAITNFLIAAGYSEQDIHLLMNQPGILELSKRAADVKDDYLSSLIQSIVDDLCLDNPAMKDYAGNSEYIGLSKVSQMKADEFKNMLSLSFDNLFDIDKLEERQAQAALLLTFKHMLTAANQLTDFVRIVRPESESGTIGTSVSDAILKNATINQFREDMKDEDFRIGGIQDIVAKRGLSDDISSAALPEVVALNTIMADNSFDLFEPYFPEVRETWVNVASEILNNYDLGSKKQKSRRMSKIVYEMALWKLLKSDTGFISGDIKEEQTKILNSVPGRVADLKKRINKAKKQIDNGDTVTDVAAGRLVTNTFLEHLTSDPKNPVATRRLQFGLNGPAIEGMKDEITAGWNALYMSDDAEIKQLAIDLFKYNVFSNGLEYGMYEFSHFAPFSVLVSTPGYITALQNMMNSDFADDAENFTRQYFMNHWNDDSFLYKIKLEDIQKNVSVKDNVITIINPESDKPEITRKLEMLTQKPYVVIRSGENNKVMTLYKRGFDGTRITFTPVEKLGFKSDRGQLTLQYNPQVYADDMKPIVSPRRQSLARSEEDVYGDSDYEMTDDDKIAAQRRFDVFAQQVTQAFGAAAWGLAEQKAKMKDLESKAEKADNANDGIENMPEAQTSEAVPSYYEGRITPDENTIFVFGSNPEGRHGAGAAKVAREQFGAIYGQGEGLQGNAYALPTKDISSRNDIGTIKKNPDNSIEFNVLTPYGPHSFKFVGSSLFARQKDGSYMHTDTFGIQGTDKKETMEYVNRKANKDLRSISPAQITESIRKMYEVARQNPSKQFKVAYTNSPSETTLNGYTGAEMIQMFKDAGPIPSNVVFSKVWVDNWNSSDQNESSSSENIASQNDAVNDAMQRMMSGIFSGRGKMFSIARTNEEGKAVIEKVPATPENIREARKQKVYVSLNKKLREILREKGVAVGVLDDAEALLGVNGITDFETAPVLAEGILEMIRIAEGYEGEQALPEEFAHIALEMLGHDNPLVKRLLDVLSSNEEALHEAYGDEYDEYARLYGEDHDKLALEAAGKLVAKQLFRQEEIETAPVRSLIQRICDAIKNFFRKFRRDEVQNAIFEANDIASKVAKGMFGGELIDLMSLDNVHQSGKFASLKTDLTGKHDVLSKLLKIEAKRLSIIKKRLGSGADLANEPSVVATQTQISKLESAIENYKTEDAIVTYMTNSLDFLAKTEQSLDNAVNAGRKANDVCKKLNTVRDTLYSFSQAIDAVNDAIVDGNVEDNQNISDSIAKVQEVISRFFIKYERYAKKYFEEMLSNVYGESGVTINIGRERGRVITIKEMARKADSDIGFMSRWFNSIADCDDYVLMAVDDTTRKAKMRARHRFNDVRPRIEKAVANLIQETGSSDTTFMFEMKRYDGGKWCNKAKDDGKLHKTGYYIAKDSIAYNKLSKAQKEFYDVFMEIKKMADNCIPESLVEDNRMIMLRKYTLQRVKDAEGIGGKILTGWEGIRNAVMETSDEYDPEYEEVAVDFENNKVDRLPIKYLRKGSKEQYDDMTDDVASSLVAYAGMAFEFDEVNGVINILENAKYMASERMITQKTGSKTKRETINTDPDKKDEGIMFREPFSQKAMSSNAQAALEDFFQMHLYGHIHKAEGTFGNTRISKRKVVDALNNVTSLTQMAINLPQRFANVNTGMSQILIESIGKGHFKPKDLSWAIGVYTKATGDRLVDLGKTDYDNKLSLFADKFDLHQDNGRRQTGYSKKRISRILNSSLLYAGLTAGEDFLALTTGLAIAHTYKVKGPDGKIGCLYDAYEVRYSGPNKTGAYIALKDGYTREDGGSIEEAIPELRETFEEQYEKECAAMNFEMQGIYNLDDRSAIQQYAAGSLLIMYRKWIAPSLRRRYGKTKYNALKGEFEEGYYTTVLKFLRDSVIDSKNSLTEEQSANALLSIYNTIKGIKNSMSVNWDKLTEYEKSNMKRAEAEMAIVIGLYTACALSGKVPPRGKDGDPEYQPTWWDRQVMSQIFRLRSELGSQAPTPMMINEALHIMRSPFAAMGPITSTLNGLKLLTPAPYMTDIKSGRYKGHTKAYKYFRELPIIAAYKKIENFIDPTPLINYYKNEIVY